MLKGYGPYLWREWLTLCRPQAYRHHVHHPGADHAAARLCRRHHDGGRSRRSPRAAHRATCRLKHFDQIFSAHGTIMIFFMAMPFVIGMMNFVVPLQLGVRDNGVSDLELDSPGADASGILLINISPRGRRIRENRLGCLSAAERAAILARSRRRLLSLVATNLRRRHLDGPA